MSEPFVQYGQIENKTVLKKYRLLRRVYLSERLEIEESQCAICDFNREILYWGSYDRDINVECFNVCQSCAGELIDGTERIITEVRA
jgi:hypothetical protein